MEQSEVTNSVKVLAFAGSLRKESYNKKLLRAAKEQAPEQLDIEIYDLADIPLFNQDVEAEGDPAPVEKFKKAIRKADSVLIATPEYNHGVPGVTKNAVDWASRPPKKGPLNEKPVGVIGASPGVTGAARGQSQLRQAFEFTNSYCMPQPEVLLFKANKKFDDEGNLSDENSRKFLNDYLKAFYEWTLKFEAETEVASRH